jgi:hypothetical protein
MTQTAACGLPLAGGVFGGGLARPAAEGSVERGRFAVAEQQGDARTSSERLAAGRCSGSSSAKKRSRSLRVNGFCVRKGASRSRSLNSSRIAWPRCRGTPRCFSAMRAGISAALGASARTGRIRRPDPRSAMSRTAAVQPITSEGLMCSSGASQSKAAMAGSTAARPADPAFLFLAGKAIGQAAHVVSRRGGAKEITRSPASGLPLSLVVRNRIRPDGFRQRITRVPSARLSR